MDGLTVKETAAALSLIGDQDRGVAVVVNGREFFLRAVNEYGDGPVTLECSAALEEPDPVE